MMALKLYVNCGIGKYSSVMPSEDYPFIAENKALDDDAEFVLKLSDLKVSLEACKKEILDEKQKLFDIMAETGKHSEGLVGEIDGLIKALAIIEKHLSISEDASETKHLNVE